MDENSPENGHNISSDDDGHENSPESAGLARGLARSAVPKGAGRIAVGRLPLRPGQIVTKTASKTSRVAARTRMARIQRVAKVSDRASTGFDFVEAHQESNVEKKSWRNRASNFVKSLAKNTILGMAVFATYEEMIDLFEVKNQNEDLDLIDTSSGGVHNGKRQISSTLLSQHYAAGFCAGSVHAGLESVIESFVAVVWRPLQHRFLSPEASAVPSNAARAVFFPNLLHHATAHAVLFGSYETVKRTAKLVLANTNNNTDDTHTSTGTETNSMEHETDHGFLDGHLVAVSLAGGTAGVFQQVVGDVTEQMTKALQLERENAAKGKDQQQLGKMIASIRPPRYSARSLLMLSIPTSIGFVAFEYGREAVIAD